jgi:iron complex outermembrane receptor protein
MPGFKRALLAGSAGLWIAGTAVAAEVVVDDPSKPTEIDGVTVTGTKIGHAVGLKSDTPILETPRAVSVITAQTLQEQGITRLADALRNVAGVSRSSTYGYFDSYQIRGYDAAYGSIFLDGLTSGNVAGAVNELAGLEQVEVIKGPASALFGASPLGGVINLVSKRPKAEPSLDIGVATGSYDLREVTVDANRALTRDGSLLGRVNIVYRDSDDFVDYAHSQRIYVAPALTWKIGADTSLTLLGRYQRDYDSPWSPVSAWGTILPSVNGPWDVRRSVNGRGAQKAVNNVNAKQIGYVFDHRFSDTLSFSQNVRYENRETYWNRWMFVSGFVNAPGRGVVGGVQQDHVLGRYLYGPFSETDKDFAADSRVTATFDTGSIGHKVLAGIDYRRTRSSNVGTGNYNASENPLDILNPNYDAPYTPGPAAGDPIKGRTSQVGFYLHDHVTVGERLTLTLGGRWDTAKSGGQEDSKFSPSAGATWSLTPEVSLYANYSKSFTPTPSWQTRFDGSLLPPETGENIEAGLKTLTGDGKLSGMVSIYQLTRQNVATEDPAHLFFYVVTGEQRSRGVEVEGAWRPTTAVEITAAYSHIDAKVTKDNVLPVGLPLANFPKDALNLWGKYTVRSGPFAKLGISLGALYNSDRHFNEVAGGVVTLYTLPSYTLFNAGLSYPFGPWNVNLNVDNLTDERFFPDACCLDRITPGEPRNWRLSLRRGF